MRMFQKGKSWYVDHTYDDEKDTRNLDFDLQNDDISTISGGSEPPVYSKDRSLILETPQEKKLRKRSHWVAYATMFVMSIGFSVVLSGVWPYLQELDDTLTKESLGWVVAANPLGQMIASPIVGYLGNRLGSIRVVCYFTMTVFMLGNLIYGFLPAMTDWWDHSAFHIMIIARFIVGLSSANITLCRSYLAVASTSKERTTTMAIVSAFQSLGFVVGPVIQTVLSLTISDEMMTYRSCGWVAAALGLINFFILTPWVFQEYNISEKERSLMAAEASDKDQQIVLPRADYPALFTILFGFFMCQFIYVLIETLMEPFMADQYEWCNELAVIVVGVALAAAGILTVFMFALATKLNKKYDERIIMVCGAFIPLCLGLFMFIPWGPDTLNYCPEVGSTTSPSLLLNDYTNPLHKLYEMDEANGALLRAQLALNQDLFYDNDLVQSTKVQDDSKYCDEGVCYGCPSEQEWCEGYNKLPMVQFFVAYLIVFAGYPFGIAMSNGIYSKILGPKPQGTWMGILTAAGSLARVLGPVFVTYIYTNKGTTLTFAVILIGMICALALILFMYKRLVPMQIEKRTDPNRN